MGIKVRGSQRDSACRPGFHLNGGEGRGPYPASLIQRHWVLSPAYALRRLEGRAGTLDDAELPRICPALLQAHRVATA
jgi:hypothetical protein